ncbi:MAG: nickel pincer cofactor biosynthesis protein LarC [Fimbriimonadaceae bacterium]|nr:nickel pincer cofactor biosynthesis protein LarC [Fimbriimonadaceae bacterium]
MQWAWFDPAAGASGDMILGALLAAGLPEQALRDGLQRLGVPGWRLEVEQVTVHGIAATRAKVLLDDAPQPHRHVRHVVDIIAAGDLPPIVAERAKAVFERLAAAEAAVHNTTIERVHFHEVGAVDAIVDVVGACLGLHLLEIERVACGPLPVSHGWVDCAHGRLPVPPPAVVRLLEGVPTRPLDVAGETLTPTGAAILTTLCEQWTLPAMTWGRSGYGAGSKDFGIPNVLRLTLGETAPQPAAAVVIEANLDDMNPEWYERAVERLFAAGGLDVTLQPVQMKKGRPGVLLRVVCDPPRREAVTTVILTETTTLGVRWFTVQRDCLAREWHEVSTSFGPVRVKIGRRAGRVLNIAPEYESCRQAADAAGAALPAVYAAAAEAARRLVDSDAEAPH